MWTNHLLMLKYGIVASILFTKHIRCRWQLQPKMCMLSMLRFLYKDSALTWDLPNFSAESMHNQVVKLKVEHSYSPLTLMKRKIVLIVQFIIDEHTDKENAQRKKNEWKATRRWMVVQFKNSCSEIDNAHSKIVQEYYSK